MPNQARVDARSKLAEAYRGRQAALARFLAARLGNRDDADDVLQELYLHIDKADPATDIRDPVAYLFRTAANLARDYTRGRRRAAARDQGWAAVYHDANQSEPMDEAPSAERVYDGRQRLEAVRHALEELSPQCRRIFILHKIDGLSHAEIATNLSISRSTVEKHMNTALKHLIRRVGRD